MKIKYLLLLALPAMMLAAACKKTDTIEVPAQASNRILSYKITNVPDEPVYGAVNDEKGTITVILPYYYYLTTIQPEIAVSEGATVSPASGVLIDNITKKLTEGANIEYVVTGKDGRKATYRLLLTTQQPEITLDELSPDAANPTVLYHSKPATSEFNFYDITGKNFIPQQELLGIFSTISYLNEQGGIVYTVVNGDNYTTRIGATVPSAAQVPEGLYRIRVTSYTRSATMKNPVKIQSR
ncbi:hypothetical protein [Chitinophaga ginsengisoli]|uniref:Secreted protein (Por secretion system target) n=1 Tax=Chitinophaga ginsengisoli TaxID=363837 RepID=A0A2P8GHI3_9BACT|nr:hypothetical protein [Chitinophaga ginsengisoli]PSL33415.1 hypothetical protein CLV42_103398 [Chitinophaga ginsengisoli]